MSASERFWSMVDKRGPDDCWEWRAAKTRGGYGSFTDNGLKHVASRYAWEDANGKRLGRRFACHKCDNKGCCNPAHIYAGTPLDNSRDAVERGLTGDTGGERNGAAKLNWEQVRAIKKRLASGEDTYVVSFDYGVTEGAIRHIKAGRTWKEQNGTRT